MSEPEEPKGVKQPDPGRKSVVSASYRSGSTNMGTEPLQIDTVRLDAFCRHPASSKVRLRPFVTVSTHPHSRTVSGVDLAINRTPTFGPRLLLRHTKHHGPENER
jgi:hypothetical protein